MIAIWISFALFFLYALFTREIDDSLWIGLLFLWVLLAIHYWKSHRKWKKLDALRRQERQYTVNTHEKAKNETD